MPQEIIGRAPESLSLEERWALTGKWIALEIYQPATLPLRQIQAVAASPLDCVKELASRGLDPRRFEFQLLSPPY